MDLKAYYTALETRLGNYLIFGGRAHLGLYPRGTWWPFPIHRALLAMEDHLFHALALQPGSTVLDAGCGDAQVAIYLASKGLRVQAIDVLAEQVQRARSTVARSGMQHLAVTMARDDYHRLESVDEASLDGVYTMETLVHARDPMVVMAEFLRVLKPGGRLSGRAQHL
ncbi:hypothetical protein FE257_011284 [Aspergillus nanangensis]|uniref:Methyltransferase type 11 domain-containing protein n=1 Tax=Aspergillus nanangensis TaxID=2582783 RepID=A0AAD4CHM3_ASPNN|nr:hypothetical protein FE257_011284 [Aspergillus nanangensis]